MKMNKKERYAFWLRHQRNPDGSVRVPHHWYETKAILEENPDIQWYEGGESANNTTWVMPIIQYRDNLHAWALPAPYTTKVVAQALKELADINGNRSGVILNADGRPPYRAYEKEWLIVQKPHVEKVYARRLIELLPEFKYAVHLTQIAGLTKNHEVTFKPLSREDRPLMVKCIDQWGTYNEERAKAVPELQIDIIDALKWRNDWHGVCGYIDGELAGFMIGSRLSNNQFSVIMRIAVEPILGFEELMFQALARQIPPTYEWIVMCPEYGVETDHQFDAHMKPSYHRGTYMIGLGEMSYEPVGFNYIQREEKEAGDGEE
jgi:hypothetical protein